MHVFIQRDSPEQPVGARVAILGGFLARVPVGYPRRELLQRDIGDGLHGASVARIITHGHVSHPSLFERDRVDSAGDNEIIAQGRAVPCLFRSPSTYPFAPGAVTSEAG